MSGINSKSPKNLARFSKTAKAWVKGLNLVGWKDRAPKYDIRDWSPTGQIMGKCSDLLSKIDRL